MLERDDREHPVPLEWRAAFRQIVETFLAGDFQLRHYPVENVKPAAASIATSISANILAYGDELAALDTATWESSIYRWMDGEWQFLVDLTTNGETVSDLTLHARVIDATRLYLEIQSVHVP